MSTSHVPSYSFVTAVCAMIAAAESAEGGFITAIEMRRILVAEGLPTNPMPPAPMAVNTDEAPRPASGEQKEVIIRLINNPVITRAEKTKMLLNVNKFSDDYAAAAITNLRAAITKREAAQRVAA